jgi:hypothetical protein
VGRIQEALKRTNFNTPNLITLTSAASRLMRCYPVSTRINHVGNDDEECSRPVKLAQNKQTLFGRAVP